jgi:hypothetical protein|tara:strand:+ start:138 stop:374 length:237 start_codon:yes stop_codon:yes gene_type:complete
MSKEAIASASGEDYEYLEDYRYALGETSRAVYAIGEEYYCAGKKHPKNLLDLAWKEAPDQWMAKRKNTVVWVANCIDE